MLERVMYVVFTDLDGTLLDHDTYSFEDARPALDRLRRKGTPVVFTTSKTRAETEPLRARTGNTHPFITENGGAVFIPLSYFPFEPPGSQRRADYHVIEYGTPYETLISTLAEAARRSGCRVRGFSDLSAAELAEVSGLPPTEAELAKAREYDEPFEILDEPDKEARLLAEIERLGRRWTRGGRFYHILGDNDKAAAVAALLKLYRRAYGDVIAIGLGDGMNDVDFLKIVDVPVLIQSRSTEKMQAAVLNGRVTAAWGPRGWNSAILEMFPE
jgi:mannosyl-3-phosphoglycerate phosphatase